MHRAGERKVEPLGLRRVFLLKLRKLLSFFFFAQLTCVLVLLLAFQILIHLEKKTVPL